MHKAIHKLAFIPELLLVDGNGFRPFCTNKDNNNDDDDEDTYVEHRCIKGGDNEYSAIAAASILAKVERDKYIEELCNDHPYLCENYSIDTNKGYGAKKHLDGIKNHGISQWHRKTYGICKNY